MKYGLLSILGLFVVSLSAGCGGGGGGVNSGFADPYTGSWRGSWTNQSSSANDAVNMVMADNHSNQTVTMTWTVNGNAFGVGSLPSFVMTGSYTANSFSASYTAAGEGTITVNVDSGGNITGGITGLPSSSGVSQVTFTGTSTSQNITLNYTIHNTDNTTQQGVITLTKQAV